MFMGIYTKIITEFGQEIVNESIDAGHDFMREVISGDASTGHPWHAAKNAANGFEPGARIGNKVPFMYKGYASEIDPKSGNMLSSVKKLGPATSPDGKNIVGLFGWIDAEPGDAYFIQQDKGTYAVGNKVGMGLLNEGRNSPRKYAAAQASEQAMIRSAKNFGFKVSGEAKF